MKWEGDPYDQVYPGQKGRDKGEDKNPCRRDIGIFPPEKHGYNRDSLHHVE